MCICSRLLNWSGWAATGSTASLSTTPTPQRLIGFSSSCAKRTTR
uniref:Uncharacterized protein n=1 Tax=Timema cristinae TaxID=61476 RepID=A0A7R9DR76_TIMCR|nr:unnamed protein product [Timema cristinae]